MENYSVFFGAIATWASRVPDGPGQVGDLDVHMSVAAVSIPDTPQ
jgi:hypothetical protein